jgi:hypothetical protein
MFLLRRLWVPCSNPQFVLWRLHFKMEKENETAHMETDLDSLDPIRTMETEPSSHK